MSFRRVKSLIRRVPAQKTGFTINPYKSETEMKNRDPPPIDEELTDDQVFVQKVDPVMNRIEMKQKFAESVAKRHKKWAKRVKAETGLEIPEFNLNKYTCRYRLTVADPTPESKFGCVSLSSPKTQNFFPKRCIIPRPLPDIPMCARLKRELPPQRLPRPVTWVPRDPEASSSKAPPPKKASAVRKVDPCIVKYYCDDLYSIPSKYRPEGEEIDPYDNYWKENTLTVLSPVEFPNDCVRLSSPKVPSYLNPDKMPTLLPWPHPRKCTVKEDDIFWEQKKVTDDFFRRLCIKPPPIKRPPPKPKPKKKPPPKVIKVEVKKAVQRKPFIRYRDPCERVTGDSDALEQFFKERGISSSYKSLSSASAPEMTTSTTIETKQTTRKSVSQNVIEIS